MYTSDTKLPKTLDFHFKSGIRSIRDNSGRLIQLGTRLKAELQPNRQYAIYDPIAYMQNDYLKIVNNSTSDIESVEVELIAEDPTNVNVPYDQDSVYPVPANMIPTIKDLIFSKELNIMVQEIVDEKNNSNDDTNRNA